MKKSGNVIKGLLAVGVTLGIGLSVSGMTLAQDKKAAEIQYRQNLFKMVYASAGNVRNHVSGAYAPGGADGLVNNAKALAGAAANVKEAFRANTTSLEGKTAALPLIWDNYDDFSAKADKLAGDTAALLAAAESGGDVGGALRTVFSNCKGCHDKYKE